MRRADESAQPGEKNAALLTGRSIAIPLGTFATGFLFGVRRGTRMSSLQYLAENAHRAPRTMEGWYFYSRTKNYRVMWGGMKEGCRGGMRLAGVGILWVGLEAMCRQSKALNGVREIVAGGGSGLLVAMLGKLAPRGFLATSFTFDRKRWTRWTLANRRTRFVGRRGARRCSLCCLVGKTPTRESVSRPAIVYYVTIS